MPADHVSTVRVMSQAPDKDENWSPKAFVVLTIGILASPVGPEIARGKGGFEKAI